MGSASSRILTTLTIRDEDRNNYLKVKEATECYVQSKRVNEVFNLYIFTQQCQEEGKSFDHFFTSLCQLVTNCKFNQKDAESVKNKMLHVRRSRLVASQLEGVGNTTRVHLVSFMGHDAKDIYKSFTFGENKVQTLEAVLNKFDTYFLPKMQSNIQVACLFTYFQREGQTFDTYLG
ncbi:hypothetical protein PR048_005109 [Dryococelus australis]|uniref:Uncharacterized protein n=1 Tax=Dryococelus australis TaxID=614101 RepID=A0ABQ9I797_9NEOP|nr:hypothetical protein PR048_005109 [Dryococelus australis]